MYDINPAGPMMHLKELERSACSLARLKHVRCMGSERKGPSKWAFVVPFAPLAWLGILASIASRMGR
jgi:hypothetical protein